MSAKNEETLLAPEFWKAKTLQELNAEEWEALCDRCGQCCLLKLEDEDTGDIAVTRLACKLLDLGTCQCSNYSCRKSHVPDCIELSPQDVLAFRWLPKTCAYRLLGEGKDLYWWHPLRSGSADTVHEAGISIRNKAIPETSVAPENHPKHISHWLK